MMTFARCLAAAWIEWRQLQTPGSCNCFLNPIVPLKKIEYGFGNITIRSPCTPYSIYIYLLKGDYKPWGRDLNAKAGGGDIYRAFHGKAASITSKPSTWER